MTQTLNIIDQTIKKHYPEIRAKYHIKKIGVFGSVVRGDDTLDSDVDILVDFKNPPGMFGFIRLENYLGQLLKRKVDLVTKPALKPLTKDQILQEVHYV